MLPNLSKINGSDAHNPANTKVHAPEQAEQIEDLGQWCIFEKAQG